jgi:hypothetical protein
VSDLQAAIAVAQDVTAVKDAAEERGWSVALVEGILVDIDLASGVDGETYRLRFVCRGYPDAPPSILPVDPATGSSQVRSAWPSCQGFRPTTDICMPLSAEGYSLHPVWRHDPVLRWISVGNPLLRVIDELQARLDDPTKYQGRAQ